MANTPVNDDERKIQHCLTITRADKEQASIIGNGNASKGFRIALDFCSAYPDLLVQFKEQNDVTRRKADRKKAVTTLLQENIPTIGSQQDKLTNLAAMRQAYHRMLGIIE